MRIVIQAFVASSLLACSDADIISRESVVTSQIPTWERFEADSTIRAGAIEEYVIEGDIGVSRSTLEEYYAQHNAPNATKSSVATSGGNDITWSATEKLDITYCIANAWGSQKSRAIADMSRATSQWASAANVRFIYVPSQDAVCSDTNTGTRINVSPGNAGGIGCFPNNCRYLKVNYAGNYGEYSWLGVWTHEVGHVLGLGHEHINAPCNSNPAGESIRLINTYDPNSSLHYNVCGSASKGQMSSIDAAGLRTLYGQSASHVVMVLPTEWVIAAASSSI